jgi:hypothetical protein
MSIQKNILDHIRTPLEDADSLWDWVCAHTGLRVPKHAVCPHHQAPWNYLLSAYFEPASDLVVWAPRGGGKTRLAAVATLLDLLHKPGCAVRILGGSLEQSLRMWEHLLPDLENLGGGLLRLGNTSAHKIRLSNRSSAAVLTQSQRAVRGLRVQKLRCDEVELFDPQVWNAAQLVTRSLDRGEAEIAGTIEAISTFHAPWGLMAQVIDSAQQQKKRIVHWCILEVLERCPPARDCRTCPLWEECRGVAKTRCAGFVSIDDAIALKQRVSRETWEAEMLCRRPVQTSCVFPTFVPEIHVRDGAVPDGEMSLAIDFGFHNPFVCLWIVDAGAAGVHVIDEYVQPQRIVVDHLREIDARGHGTVRRVCCDPSGAGRNDQTAESNVQMLRRHGFRVLSHGSRIIEGLELIRAALRPGYGRPSLFIHPRCVRLIEAMQKYRYPEGGGELPLKDGVHDHLIDALRYFYVNRSSMMRVITRRY